MKTHEYFCNRIHYVEMLIREEHLWHSINGELMTRSRIKSIMNHLHVDQVHSIEKSIIALLKSHGADMRWSIHEIIERLKYLKLRSEVEIVEEWAVHVLRKYKRNQRVGVIDVSVQAIERSDREVIIRNVIGNPAIPFVPELVTHPKAYCMITRLLLPDGAIIFDKEIIDEICLDR